jgi:iron(III) transport system substrate-binding protein
VPSAEALPPLESIGAPAVDPSSLDQERVTELMQEVGLL